MPPELRPADETAVEEESAAESDDPSEHCNDPDYWNSREYGDPSDYVEACEEWPYWVPESGEDACGPGLCGDQGEGMTQEEYCATYGEYGTSECPRHLSPSAVGGEEPTSADVQRQHGCEQGYLPPEER